MRIVAAIVLLCAGLGTASGQGSTPTPERLQSAATRGLDSASGNRLPLLTRGDMRDEASSQIYDTLAGPDGEPPRGTLGVALYSPATAAALGRIHAYLWTESALEPRLLELLSLIAAREMHLAYEWRAHQRTALQVGLEPEVIEAVRLSLPVDALSNLDALIIGFGRQLFRSRHVDSSTFAALRAGKGQTVVPQGYDVTSKPRDRIRQLEDLARLVPAVAGTRVRRTFAGVIDLLPDLQPVIGRIPGTANAFAATGFSGHGYMYGPGACRAAAELIAEGATSVDLEPYRPERLTEKLSMRSQIF